MTTVPKFPAKIRTKAPYGLMLLIVVQAFCVVFFVFDALSDFRKLGGSAFADLHLQIETVATVALFAAIIVEIRVLMQSARRTAHLQKSLTSARAAVHDVIDEQFGGWHLTNAENDVANFLVKGMSISEISALRGTAEGTVKAHLNAVYRKAGVRNRAELMSLLIDNIMGARLEAD